MSDVDPDAYLSVKAERDDFGARIKAVRDLLDGPMTADIFIDIRAALDSVQVDA